MKVSKLKMREIDTPKIEDSSWAINFLKDCPTGYKEAIEIASDPYLRVEVIKSNDAGSVDEYLYVIIPESNNGFWLDAFQTEEEALKLIKGMGWKMID